MLASDLIEVLCAAHLTHHVESPGFHDRGGIMLIGAPGVLKSTFTSVLDKQYHDAVMMSDVNAQTLVQLRDDAASGRINTLVLPEFAKLYERQPATATNVEGMLRAMVAEGFQTASFEDQRINKLKARALLIGAMTPAMVTKRFTGWEESGFNRRFLWCLLRLDDPEILERAVLDWQMIDFQVGHVPRPPISGERIPQSTSAEERRLIQKWVKYQPGGSHTLHLQLLTKIVCVLRWWYREVGVQRDPMRVVGAFAESLGRDGAVLSFPKKTLSSHHRGAETRRLRKQAIHAAAQQLARAKQPVKRKREKK